MHAGAHPKIFKEGGLNFSKSNQYPIAVNLVIVKQVSPKQLHRYNISLLKNLVITILKVVACEDCVQKNNLPLWGQSPQLLGNSCNFSEKSSHFNAIWMTF